MRRHRSIILTFAIAVAFHTFTHVDNDVIVNDAQGSALGAGALCQAASWPLLLVVADHRRDRFERDLVVSATPTIMRDTVSSLHISFSTKQLVDLF